MDIKEIKEKKKALDNKIGDLMRGFETETGATIGNVLITSRQPKTMIERWTIARVHVEVTL